MAEDREIIVIGGTAFVTSHFSRVMYLTPRENKQ